MHIVMIQSDARSREKPCLRCGYSLRKLADSRHCPECGLSVWLSLNNNDVLDASNPAWLRRMSLAAWAMAGITTVAILAMAATWIGTIGGTPSSSTIQTLIVGFFIIAYHAALWGLAAHEQRYPDRLKVYRIAAQSIAVIGVIAGFMLLCFGLDRIVTRGGPMLLLASWDLPLRVICIASAFSTFAFLRKLAQRMMNSRLTRLTGYLLLGPVTSLVLAWPLLVFYLAGEILWVIKYLPWVYYPASVALLVWYARAFHRCADRAEEHWAAETLATSV
jgi:hypothetical protein